MLTSAYSKDKTLALPARHNEPCETVPQTGVHLFHFALSLCSQKTRQVLEEKGVSWTSHHVLLPAYQQYEPEYVRINPRCVVPALVIHGRVTTDSAHILNQVDQHFGDSGSLQLTKEQEQEAMLLWVERADALLIEALTYGEINGARRPLMLQAMSNNGASHQQKARLLSTLAKQHHDDPVLRAAYESKLAIVEAISNVIRSPVQMNALLDSTQVAISALANQLSNGPFSQNGWLCAAKFTLADIQWGVVLYRLKFLGLAELLWGKHDVVERYCSRLFARPSFKRGIIHWNNVPRRVVLPMLQYTLTKALRGKQ